MPESINELNADLFGGKASLRESDPLAARKKAMDFLARREYGHAELVGRLIAAGFEAETAGAAVATLTADGLQDDRRFAEHFATARTGRGTGPVRIRQALKERGIPSALVDQVIGELDTDWFEQARQMRFLQYRGFETDHIQHAMRPDDL